LEVVGIGAHLYKQKQLTLQDLKMLLAGLIISV